MPAICTCLLTAAVVVVRRTRPSKSRARKTSSNMSATPTVHRCSAVKRYTTCTFPKQKGEEPHAWSSFDWMRTRGGRAVPRLERARRRVHEVDLPHVQRPGTAAGDHAARRYLHVQAGRSG